MASPDQKAKTTLDDFTQLRLLGKGSYGEVYLVQRKDTKAVYAGAVTYLKLAGVVLCGWQMARAMMVALDKKKSDPGFYGAKLITARFYAQAILPQADALATSAMGSGATVNAMSTEMF